MSDGWVRVCATSELLPGELKVAWDGDTAIVVFNYDGDFYALNDCCTHEDASLSDGTIEGDEIECPMHGGAFEIKTGMPAAFPVVVPAQMYEVRVVGDDIQIGM